MLRAFLADLVGATRHYVNQPREAKQALVASKMVGIPLETFLEMKDYERPLDARVDMESFSTMVADLNRFGFVTKPVNLSAIIDNAFLPR